MARCRQKCLEFLFEYLFRHPGGEGTCFARLRESEAEIGHGNRRLKRLGSGDIHQGTTEARDRERTEVENRSRYIDAVSDE